MIVYLFCSTGINSCYAFAISQDRTCAVSTSGLKCWKLFVVDSYHLLELDTEAILEVLLWAFDEDEVPVQDNPSNKSSNEILGARKDNYSMTAA